MLFLMISLRVLFIASIVFVIGYVFGNFAATPALKTLTRIAVILIIVIFIGMNIGMRAAWRHGHGQRGYGQRGGWCGPHHHERVDTPRDSAHARADY